MEGKRVMVFGVANDRSIAWGIAKVMHEHGARLGFNYAGEVLEKRVRPLAESVNAELIIPCDVTDDDQVAATFARIREEWGGLDVLVHSLAFAKREELMGRFADTTREGFRMAMEISTYSLVHLSREAAALMTDGGAIVTMTYFGAEKVVENYNVMGVAKAGLESAVRYLAADLGPQNIRINAVSAGPIKTLAAAGGVKNFRGLMSLFEEKAPLRRNVTLDDVGKATLFLCSDLGGGVTGEVLHVDLGFNVLGH
jgi:enoyl-[acyl-carrier protein] reductase I